MTATCWRPSTTCCCSHPLPHHHTPSSWLQRWLPTKPPGPPTTSSSSRRGPAWELSRSSWGQVRQQRVACWGDSSDRPCWQLCHTAVAIAYGCDSSLHCESTASFIAYIRMVVRQPLVSNACPRCCPIHITHMAPTCRCTCSRRPGSGQPSGGSTWPHLAAPELGQCSRGGGARGAAAAVPAVCRGRGGRG